MNLLRLNIYSVVLLFAFAQRIRALTQHCAEFLYVGEFFLLVGHNHIANRDMIGLSAMGKHLGWQTQCAKLPAYHSEQIEIILLRPWK